MASYLLDTHTLLWHLTKSPKLSPTSHNIITSPEHNLFVSVATYWEMTIKASLGKLDLPVNIDILIRETEQDGILTLPIEPSFFAKVYDLPFHHRDPFDRMIIATAQILEIPVITKDSVFSKYEIDLVW